MTNRGECLGCCPASHPLHAGIGWGRFPPTLNRRTGLRVWMEGWTAQTLEGLESTDALTLVHLKWLELRKKYIYAAAAHIPESKDWKIDDVVKEQGLLGVVGIPSVFIAQRCPPVKTLNKAVSCKLLWNCSSANRSSSYFSDNFRHPVTKVIPHSVGGSR